MARYALLLLFAATLACSAYGEEVVSLTDEDFHSKVDGEALTLVEFYAPWCGHCKRLEPEYEKAAIELKEEGIKLYKVDTTIHEKVGQEFGIEGFPTLKIFKNGKASEYKGGRTADAIVDTLRKQSGPAVKDMTDEEITKAKEDEKVFFVGFFSEKDSAAAKAYAAVADSKRDKFTFGLNSNPGSFGAAANSVSVFKPWDSPRVVNLSDVTSESLDKFVDEHSLPLCGEIGPDNFEEYLERQLPFFWLFLKFEANDFESLRKTCSDVAAQYKGKMTFVYLDGEKYGEQATSLGVASGVLPAFAINNDDKHYAADLNEFPLTADGFKAYADKYLAGELVPSVMSEEIPAVQGNVRVVVGKSFEDEVFNGSKDVLIEFYAPWCGHCKSLAPIWDQLGDALAGNDNIVIAKMDATANDVPSFMDVQGFPTIKFVKGGSKDNIKDYDGGRTLEDFTKYLQENASKPFKMPFNYTAFKKEYMQMKGFMGKMEAFMKHYEQENNIKSEWEGADPFGTDSMPNLDELMAEGEHDHDHGDGGHDHAHGDEL